jgi:hypothetical protein
MQHYGTICRNQNNHNMFKSGDGYVKLHDLRAAGGPTVGCQDKGTGNAHSSQDAPAWGQQHAPAVVAKLCLALDSQLQHISVIPALSHPPCSPVGMSVSPSATPSV